MRRTGFGTWGNEVSQKLDDMREYQFAAYVRLGMPKAGEIEECDIRHFATVSSTNGKMAAAEPAYIRQGTTSSLRITRLEDRTGIGHQQHLS